MITPLIRFCVRNPVVTLVLTIAGLVWGAWSWTHKTVDAIPDISENQVVVVAEWPGRSPQDVEDQITYPLATALAGVRGVEEVRALSGFGFSQVYVVFEEEIRLFQQDLIEDFYQSRTRVLEKLSSVQELLPEGVVPELGPDATALGQVFWYTVDGPYDLATLRSVQDFVVRYDLQALSGVAEVASAGGMVRQYQVDVDPDKLRHYGVGILDVARAIRRANVDVGAKTIEQAGAEYVLRGVGFIEGIQDIEDTAVGYMTARGFVPVSGVMGMGGGMSPGTMGMPGPEPRGLPAEDGALSGAPIDLERTHRPLLVRDVARVELGPEFRRGALADERGEVVGGVVVMRFGENPRDVIARVHEAILRLNDPANGLLPAGVRITPFYDRTLLIDETVETLETALIHELWITVAVVILFMLHLRSSLIVAAGVPLAVLLAFVAMDLAGVDSNIMSLTGIAIAIGTMVDMGVVMTENVYSKLVERRPDQQVVDVVEEAAVEVGPALVTAVSTTVLSFLPIFYLTDMEGKLFRPLAWTKTFALAAAAITGVLLVPVLCRLFLLSPRDRGTADRGRWLRAAFLLAGSLAIGGLAARLADGELRPWVVFVGATLIALALGWRMGRERLVPIEQNPASRLVHRVYEPSLRWVLAHKGAFLLIPLAILLAGALVAVGARALTWPARLAAGDAADDLRPVSWLEERFPGIGQEFMPSLDEGSLLYMPSLLPHASLSQTLEVMQRQNVQFEALPEVARVVGKLGRAETALDPAPVGMLETVILLKDRDQWRPGMQKQDIIDELMRRAHTPGLLEGAGAWLQPIETRVIMLNSGIRAPLAVKLIGAPRGPDGEALDAKEGVALLEEVAGRVRQVIADVPGVAGPNVENLGGKPYTEVEIDRERAAHLGITVGDVQDVLMTAVGGMVVDRTVEGRERYSVRVAYDRELRDRLEVLDEVFVRGADGSHVPLSQVATIQTTIGPAMIKTEDGRLRLHVTFAARDRDEGSVMEDVLERIAGWRAEHVAAGHPDPIPPGVSVEAEGRYESQQRAQRRFAILIPICLALILFLLYLQFRSLFVSTLVFAAVPVCVAGGFLLMAVYPDLRDWMFELGLWDRPSTGPIYMTVAVVVGFIALAGIAVDDGVVMATYLEQVFERRRTTTVPEIREAVLEAGLRRIRPCLMTTFTTILALYPVLAASGRGSDVAQPMAIPVVGGMLVELISLFIVPCLYSWSKELRLRRGWRDPHLEAAT